MSNSRRARKSRLGLFLPLTLFVLLVAAYSAYWVIAKNILEENIDTWIATERAGGTVVEFSSKQMSGYPFLFQLTVNDPVYQANGDARWEGKQMIASMQPWNWNHIILRSPGANRVTDRAGIRHTIELDSKSAGSLSWNETGMRRAGLMINDAPALIDGAAMHLKELSVNLAPRSESPDDLMIAVQWEQIDLQDAPLFAPWLGNEIGPSRLVGEIRGFFPAYQAAGANSRYLTNTLIRDSAELEVAQLIIDWGPLDLGMQMDAAFVDGQANGKVGVRLDNVNELRAALEAEGLLDMPTQGALAMIETGSKDGQFFTLPIKENGIYILGQRVAELPIAGQ